VRVVAPGLTVAVHRGIPRVIRGLAGTGIAALNTLQARPRLQLRAVHGDVLVRQQPTRTRATAVPKLGDDATAFFVDPIDDGLPGLGLFVRP